MSASGQKGDIRQATAVAIGQSAELIIGTKIAEARKHNPAALVDLP